MFRKEKALRTYKDGNTNEVDLIFGVGNLTADIELRTATISGAEKAVVGGRGQSIAVNYYENGEKKVKFLAVEAWEKTAELLARLGKKGNEIVFAGKFLEKPYTTKDGREGVSETVVIEQFQLTSRNRGVEAGSSEPAKTGAPAKAADTSSFEEFTPVDDDDLPF